MLDIICIGNTVYDIYVKPHEAEKIQSCKNKLHENLHDQLICFGVGEKISIDEVDYSLGGSACNVAVGLRKLGLEVGLASYSGDDYIGKKVQEKLLETGINLDYFKADKNIKSFFSVILRYKNDRTILTYRGDFDADKIKLPTIKKSKWLYVSNLSSGYEKLYRKVIALASQSNVKIAINPGKEQLKNKKKIFLSLLKLSEVMILNKQEAEYLVEARFPLQIRELFYKLQEFEVKNIVITDGVNGAYTYQDKKIIHQPIYKVKKMLEKTGSGDAFSSGFLASYIQDEDVKKALRWGVINGGMVTREIGAQNGVLDNFEIAKIDED